MDVQEEYGPAGGGGREADVRLVGAEVLQAPGAFFLQGRVFGENKFQHKVSFVV